MTRVAYLCADPGVPVFGTKGSSVHVQEIVRAWRGTGAAVTVYCTRLGTERPSDLADLDVVEVKPDSVPGPARERAIQDAALGLADEVLRHGCGLFYERYSLFSPALSVVARILDVPSVLEVNAPLIEEQQRYRQLLDVKKAETVFRRNAATADVVACVSDPVVRWVQARVPTARTVLAPNGVNVERITARRPGRRNPDHLTVGFVGTLKPWHGVPGLLHGVALANQQTVDPALRWQLHVVGDGPGREDLERLADVPRRADGVYRRRRAGCRARPPGRLRRRRRTVSAGRARPGRLLLAAEGLRVHGGRAAGDRERRRPDPVHHPGRRTGILVPPGEPAALADALIRLGEDPNLRDRLGREARSDAVLRFSWSGVLSRITAALPPARRLARQ